MQLQHAQCRHYCINYHNLLYKHQCFITISATEKIHIFSHVKYDIFARENIKLLSQVPPRKSSPSSSNLRQSSENVRRRLSSLRNNFGKSLEIFGKWSEIFGKSSKTLLLVCLYNKQNNTWTLGDMEFIFSCSHSISHSFAALTRSISMWTLEDKFHISVRPCIILYII